MMPSLATLIFVGGLLHFSVLIASALVPFRLDWKNELASLSKLHWQMYWVYGGYVVMSIVAFGIISVTNATEIAEGSGLARAFCGYVCVFWLVRLVLQAVLDVKQHLTEWWLTAGYHALSVVFLLLVLIFGWGAIHG
ncbi:hypothetical protein [Bremerella sp.]|uniref:hypothetical protein n=1 Tax=Bremerella sp. TaxID=2795602 RepID=UPI00391C7A88